ncbi:MAG TPA: DNA mismatch repair protein MutT, partial [Galbitalea sp.]
LEWPPRSGSIQDFPEIDDARWLPIAEARVKVVKGQLAILDAAQRRANGTGGVQ